jgi:hypothetical protein
MHTRVPGVRKSFSTPSKKLDFPVFFENRRLLPAGPHPVFLGISQGPKNPISSHAPFSRRKRILLPRILADPFRHPPQNPQSVA